ncbi:hypothetical protein HELRODRAFT_183990 [Helobdella robusta]|uniref:Receptor ligand binding region domain-containing protein n=1 Tax=Helobdella robusta TaxID=6412 RepID=T1FKE3_HELRO|nr:hypothetical protein HELRODRAFT_183990 [Helobdella robusta]ESO09671.1 hypothetical protein HELRODRAFT_183990 [Helobdella robusta]
MSDFWRTLMLKSVVLIAMATMGNIECPILNSESSNSSFVGGHVELVGKHIIAEDDTISSNSNYYLTTPTVVFTSTVIGLITENEDKLIGNISKLNEGATIAKTTATTQQRYHQQRYKRQVQTSKKNFKRMRENTRTTTPFYLEQNFTESDIIEHPVFLDRKPVTIGFLPTLQSDKRTGIHSRGFLGAFRMAIDSVNTGILADSGYFFNYTMFDNKADSAESLRRMTDLYKMG